MTLAVLERPRPAAASSGEAALTAIAPIVPVRHVPASLRFYRDRLGFAVERENPDQSAALVARGPARLMLLRVGDKRALGATREHLSSYVWTNGLDALWAEIGPAVADLPQWRVRAPFTQPFGTREFHLKDPDGFLLLFAEEPEPMRRLRGGAPH
jgi:catechol 2,3-dioxygenase-like lactoylglutathione lyase family enzyme